MTFFSILFALLAEQLQPLRADNPFNAAIEAFGERMEGWFNAGQARHGRLAWLLTIAAVMLPVVLIYWICLRTHPILALAWNVIVLYLTLGFRHYSHYFTSIQIALNAGDDATARKLLAQWTHTDTTALEVPDIARLAIEQALVTSHRHVFGVFFWFLMPLGPACAVMYRVAEHLSRSWSEPDALKNEAFGLFAARAFYWIDWMPARLTAIAFAIVGNFEDAIYAWRNFASRWQDEAVGILLSAGSGAMGVRLGLVAQTTTDGVAIDAAFLETVDVDAEGPLGEEATVRALQSTVGLVWRGLLLWLLLLLLLSITVWVGRPSGT
ncbi:MAG: CobD/CbiB family protein [Pseudomonadota bacterium]